VQIQADSVSFVTASEPNVISETIKVVEEDQEVILRLIESQRKRIRIHLKFAQSLATHGKPICSKRMKVNCLSMTGRSM
jgi:alpha-mannosidase